MIYELFIARKVSASGKKSFTRFIIRIAILAIALSMTVMILTSAMITGFKKEITDKIFGFWGHIHITHTDISRSMLDAHPLDVSPEFIAQLNSIEPIDYEAPLSLFGHDFENISQKKRTIGAVNHVQKFALKPGIIQTKKLIEGVILKGVGTDYDWSFFKPYLMEGTVLDFPDSMSSRSILVSQYTANRLDLKVGDKFIMHFVEQGKQVRKRLAVVGIYKTGLEEYDKKIAIVDLRFTQEMLGWKSNQVAGYEVFLDDIQDLIPMVEHIYYNVLPTNLYAETIKEKFPPIFEWLTLQDLNEVVIIVLMMIVAIINMITAFLILILERTNMIGVLKSLGQSNWSIRKIFLYYAGLIVVSGLFWGNLIGIGIALMQKYFGFIRLSEADYYLAVAPISLDLWTILLLNLLTLLITIVFLIFPSYLVTKISPVRAIRFK